MDVRGCRQAVVTDLGKPLGQDVLQEAAQEVAGRHGDSLPAAGGKGDGLSTDFPDAMIGQAHAVGVSGQVTEDVYRAGKGGLGINEPVLGIQGAAELLEGLGLILFPGQRNLSLSMEPGQAMDAFAPEQF